MIDIILSDEQAYHRLADTYQNALIELQKQFAAQAAERDAVKAERDALRVALENLLVEIDSNWIITQRPCHAVDVARAELASVTRERDDARTTLEIRRVEMDRLAQECDALRAALEQLATQAEYLAGRGFVGNMKREDCEKQTIEQVRKVRSELAAKG